MYARPTVPPELQRSYSGAGNDDRRLRDGPRPCWEVPGHRAALPPHPSSVRGDVQELKDKFSFCMNEFSNPNPNPGRAVSSLVRASTSPPPSPSSSSARQHPLPQPHPQPPPTLALALTLGVLPRKSWRERWVGRSGFLPGPADSHGIRVGLCRRPCEGVPPLQ